MKLVNARLAGMSLATAMVAGLGLTACGGGGDDAPPPAASGNVEEKQAGIRVEGQSRGVQALDGEVQLLLPAVSWLGHGTLTNDKFMRMITVSASSLGEAAPGAYKSFPVGKDKTLELQSGVITDLYSNGEVSLGRWADGSDSSGNAYNANQGQPWAVGTPVQPVLPIGEKRACRLVAATRPTASDGNVAPGLLQSAEATLMIEPNTIGVTQANMALDLHYSIGTDENQSISIDGPVGALSSSKVKQFTLLSTFSGTDRFNPYVLVAYGVQTPTSGTINGVAAMLCPEPESDGTHVESAPTI
jgi:hypothetical protein